MSLTHFNEQGQAHMVDIGAKAATLRRAVAEGKIRALASTIAVIRNGTAAKGDVLAVARIAAIQASKRAGELIPLCHPIALTHVDVSFVFDDVQTIRCRCTAETYGRTGVEMEALTATSIGLLTIYDMCKSIDRGMHIQSLRLLEKSGGKSGDWQAEQ